MSTYALFSMTRFSSLLLSVAVLTGVLASAATVQASDRDDCWDSRSPNMVNACLRLAQSGSADAMWQLGIIYYMGYGVPKDVAQSASWYQKAADRGHLAATYNLAVVQLEMAKNPQAGAQAIQLMQKAADMGSIDAHSRLGELHAAGKYVKRSPEKARAFFARGAELALKRTGPCDLGCMDPLRLYAIALETGFGGPADRARATELYGKYLERLATLQRKTYNGAAMLPSQAHLRFDPVFDASIRFSRNSINHFKYQVTPACSITPSVEGAFWPKLKETDPEIYGPEFDLVVQVEGGQWRGGSSMESILQEASDQLAVCGIRLRKADYATHTSSCKPEDLSALYQDKIVVKFNQSDDRLNNSTAGLTHQSWNAIEINASGAEAGRTLAHELGHILGAMGHPTNFEPSLMQYGLLESSAARFTPNDCSWMKTSRYLYHDRLGTRSNRDLRTSVKPAFLDARSVEERFDLVEKRFANHLEVRLFYGLYIWDHFRGLDAKVIAALTDPKSSGLKDRQKGMRVYEYYHNWRPENGWPDEMTMIVTYMDTKLQWLPGFTY